MVSWCTSGIVRRESPRRRQCAGLRVVAERAEIPMGSRVVGFGPGAVYLVRVDTDDLEYLQRYRFTPRARP